MMDENLIVEKFREIKELGFVKSKRPYSTGIGKTFEDYLGVTENNEIGPDFAGFEVVSKRTQTSTFLSLFTKSPSHPRSVNTILLERYGEEYEGYPGMRKLHTSVFAGKFNTYRNAYGFRIVNDTQGKKIVLEVSSLPEMEVIDSSVYWTYYDLEQCLLTKLKALFFVYADSDMRDGTEYFHYTQADIYLDPSLENLLKLIDRGRLMIDIRIGSYKTGKMKGARPWYRFPHPAGGFVAALRASSAYRLTLSPGVPAGNPSPPAVFWSVRAIRSCNPESLFATSVPVRYLYGRIRL